jgi:3-carboxy-cis,cis-muconate cycloisomerase
MAGRSNLQQAVPITFGYKMATMLAAMQRHRERLGELRKRVLVGEFAGAAGTLSSLGKEGLKVQEGLMAELKLGQPEIAWHTVRDRIGEVGCFLGLVTGTCGKLSMDVKLLMQTEVAEVYEPFHEGRGSSSTMPQKRNPVASLYIHANAAVVRQHAAALLEAAVADHERSTGPWEIEWISLPEIFLLAAGCLRQTRHMVAGLIVDAERMRANLDITRGMVVSEAVMMGLGPYLGRQRAHDLVYDICRKVGPTGPDLLDLLAADKEISKHLTRDQLARMVDPTDYLGLAGEMVDRVLAIEDAHARR